MTREDIIRMARETGFVVDEKAKEYQPNCIFHTHHMVDELLERFAALVAAHTLANIDPSKLMSHRESFKAGAAAEREACAKVCDGWLQADGDRCAEAIRARGQDGLR